MSSSTNSRKQQLFLGEQNKYFANPFAQSKAIRTLSIPLFYKDLEAIELLLADTNLALVSYELTSKTIEAQADDAWCLDVYLDDETDIERLIETINNYSNAEGIKLDISKIAVKELADTDWLAINADNLGIITTEQFAIIRRQEQAISGKINIMINISQAFGTGEHLTTMGCLEALESLKTQSMNRILDVGTGTGILAIAAQKLWPKAHVIATDIDQVAIEVTEQHMATNKVELELRVADGIDQGLEQIDLICANILANPLKIMAHSMQQALNPGGVAILSGFLDYQVEDLLTTFTKHNFAFVSRKSYDSWVTLVLEQK